MDLDPESEDEETRWNDIEPVDATPENFGQGGTVVAPAGRMPIVSYMVADKAEHYRVVMDVLLDEESRLGLHLPVAEIGRRISTRLNGMSDTSEVPDVAKLLDSLYVWKNVDRIYNTRRAGTFQEYLTKDYLYQLTPAGARVHKTLVAIDRDLGAPGALQSSMLPEVRDALESLGTHLGDEAFDEEDRDRLLVILRLFQRAVNGFTQLSDNAKLFIQGLNQSLDLSTDLNLAVFLAYKDVVVSYLQDFVTELQRYSASIREAIDVAETNGVLELLPKLADLEAAPAIGRSRQEVVNHDTDLLRSQWGRQRNWFFGDSQREPVEQILQQRAADAVNRILATVRRFNDQRFRRINRASDLMILASWFEATDDPVDRATLWRNAFGMYSARHFGAAHSTASDLSVRANSSWWTTPAAPVTAALRTHGPRSSTGRPPSLGDPSRIKRDLAARRQDGLADREAAIARFTQLSPTLLSTLPVLTAAELELLLHCLKLGLGTAERHDGTRRARTGDGRLLVVLRELPAHAGRRPTSAVETELGVMSMADVELTIEDLNRRPR